MKRVLAYYFWNEPNAKVVTTTIDTIVHILEERGYYKKGTTRELLENGEILRTPYAYYSCNKEDLEYILKD